MFVHWVCYIHIGEQGVLVLADPSANWQILSLIDPIFLRGQQCPVNNIFGHNRFTPSTEFSERTA